MKEILCMISILIGILSHAQDHEWDWAKSIGGSASDKGNYLAVDNIGNVYITGYFDSPSISFGSTNFSNKGSFIAKYNASGNLLWAKSFGMGSIDEPFAITVDKSNNVYVAGAFFSNSISFDGITVTNPAGSFSDAYLVKFNPHGQALWARSMTGSNREFAFNVTTDNSNNVLVTGSFYSSSMFIGSEILNNAGSQNIFLAKFNSSGSLLWAKVAGGSDADNSLAIATDRQDNIYITGYFYSPTIQFGTTTLINQSSNGDDDMFIAKYNSEGNVIWAKSAGLSDNDYGRSIVADDSGNVYVAGDFYSPSINFGPYSLTNVNPGSGEVFLVKYDPSGNAVFAKKASGSKADMNHSIEYRKGSLYMTGYFGGPTIQFENTVLENTVFTSSANSFDFFIVKYDTDGHLKWAKSFGGSGNDGTLADEGPHAKTDSSGNIYITGFYDQPSMNLGSISLTNQGQQDIFLARLKAPIVLPPPALPDSSCQVHLITRVYPNPFTKSLTVEKNPTKCTVSLTIYNSLGQTCLKNKTIIDGVNIISLAYLQTGVYFYRFSAENRSLLTGKVIKQ